MTDKPPAQAPARPLASPPCPFPSRSSPLYRPPAVITLTQNSPFISPYCDPVSTPSSTPLFSLSFNLLIPPACGGELAFFFVRVTPRVVEGYINTPTPRLGREPLLAYR